MSNRQAEGMGLIYDLHYNRQPLDYFGNPRLAKRKPVSVKVEKVSEPFIRTKLLKQSVVAHRPACRYSCLGANATAGICGALIKDAIPADVETVGDFCETCIFDGDHYVYTMWAATGDPLYVGQTGRPIQRMSGHASVTPWFPWVAKITANCVPSEDAVRLEAERILEVDPAYNVRGRRSRSAA